MRPTARPTLLGSCARAATAEELRYRIDRPIRPRRGARVVALDEVAARVVGEASMGTWHAARFYTSADRTQVNGTEAEVALTAADGHQAPLRAELAGADVVVMVAAVDGSGATASAIGRAADDRGIMAAGVILGDARDVPGVVSALRPHARVLLVTSDEQDLSEVLTALRA
jgi:hypothetical protein